MWNRGIRRQKPIVRRGKKILRRRRQRIVGKKKGNYKSRYGYTRMNNAPFSSKRHMTVKQQRLLMYMRCCSHISNKTSGKNKGSRQRPKVTQRSTTIWAKRPNRRTKSIFQDKGGKNTQKSESGRNLINDVNCVDGKTENDDDDDKLSKPESWTL